MADNDACKTPAERIRLLSHYAGLIEVDNDIPPKRYFRSGLEMERMANVYLDERNFASAFILYTKFITLFVEKLPHHAEYSKATAQEKAKNKKKLNVMFKLAEELKRILTKKYEEEYHSWQELDKKKGMVIFEFVRTAISDLVNMSLNIIMKLFLHGLNCEIPTLIQYPEKRAEDEARQQKEEAIKEEERKQAERQLVQELEDREKSKENAGPAPTDGVKATPTPLQSTLIGDFPAPPTLGHVDESSIKTEGNEREHGTPSEDVPVRNTETPSLYSVDSRTPYVDRSSKPMDSTYVDSGLRRMCVPSELVRLFLDIASPNTRQNRETCGILTGKLKQNMFHITHLIIPQQTSTSDSCTTLSEEDLFEFQDSHDLITLGWIHTHPSQTAFMSSVDLHTHCSYQLMMPEAIAIVCSPKYDETGVFSLTQGYGLKFISSCKKPGFHPHPKEPPIYQESEHVTWNPESRVEVVDLRRH